MGKRLTVVLVILVIGLAALPPLFGVAYEKRLQQQIAAIPENPYARYDLIDYKRGLYASRGSLRLALSDEYIELLRTTIANQDPGRPATPEQQASIDSMLEFARGELRFDVDVQHGPLTLTGGPGVALASVRSELDSTTGKLAEFQQWVKAPYLLRADAVVGFDGSADITAAVPAMSGDDGQSSFAFSGLNADGRYENPDRSIKATGKSESFSFERDGMSLTMEDLSFASDARMLSDFLWLGNTRTDLALARIAGMGEDQRDALALRELGVDVGLDLNEAGDKVSMVLDYSIGEASGMPDFDLRDVQLRMRLRDIDRAAAEDYMRLYQKIGVATPEAMAELMPDIQAVGARVLRGSPGIDLQPVRFTFNGEPFTASFAIDFDGSSLPANFDFMTLQGDPASLLGALSGRGNIDVSEKIALLMAMVTVRGQIAGAITPEMQLTEADIDAMAGAQVPLMIEGLVQQGMIERNNGMLSTQMEFAKGQLTINGAAIPLGPQ